MRDALPLLGIALVLGGLGTFSWMTRNPEAAWIEDAQEWPVVGPLAERFREAYLGKEAAAGPVAESDHAARGGFAGDGDVTEDPVEVVVLGEPQDGPLRIVPEPDEAALAEMAERAAVAHSDSEGSRPRLPAGLAVVPPPGADVASREMPRALEIPARLALEERWALPGQPLVATPGDATPATTLRHLTRFGVVGRQGGWAQVTWRGREMWFDTEWEPGHSRRKARRGGIRHRFEPVRASDSRRLKAVREALGGASDRQLGSYDLYTDVEDEGLLDLLDSAATAAEEAYFARTGRLPAGDPDRAIVLFADESRYRVDSDRFELPGFAHAGHAGRGIATFFVGRRPADQLASTLVHEIAHLLNSRALTSFLPPWLSEGIARDLGSVRLHGPDGRLRISSDELGLLRLVATLDAGDLPESAKLMALDGELFYRPEIVSWSYAHSGALVGYLFGEEHGDGFRVFLKRIADGRGADAALLLDELGVDATELDRGFHAWLRMRAAELG